MVTMPRLLIEMLRKNLPRQSWRSSESGHISEKMNARKCSTIQMLRRSRVDPDQLQLTTPPPAALP
jgi:hypothetical protein